MGALLAIDFGTKRIGLAVTDPDRQYIFTRPTLQRSTPEADCDAIRELCEDETVELLVMGLPLNADGTEGPMAAAARAFAELLTTHTRIPAVFADERYSSQEADERLREIIGRDHRKRRALRDRAAAAIIMRTYLDHGPVL